MNKGMFVISIDTELGWGTFDLSQHEKYRDNFAKTRKVIEALIEVLEDYEISATWPIVGHLFLEECDGHPDIVRPDHSWFKEDWLTCDPRTDIKQNPFWYGKDIVERISETEPKQEIASHSFCHMIYGDKGCSREAAESDAKKCIEVAEQELKSFAFPRNSIGHLDVLKENGFKCYRGTKEVWYEKSNMPVFLKKFFRVLDEFTIRWPSVSLPKKREGLIEIPGSMQYRAFDTIWNFLPMEFRIKRIKKGIRKAVREKKMFHLWFHPFNLAKNKKQLLRGLDEIFAYVEKMREKGKLEVMTMEEVADRYI